MSADKRETPRTDLFEQARKGAPKEWAEYDYQGSLEHARDLERDLAAAHKKIAKMRKSQSEPVMWGISINDHIYNAEFHKAFAEQKIQASKDAEGQYPSRYEIVPLFRALKE